MNVTGTNDAPVITSSAVDQTIAATNAALSSSRAVTSSVVPFTTLFRSSITGSTISSVGVTLTQAQQDSFTNALIMNTDGTWAFNLASPDYLAVGVSVTTVYHAQVIDDQGAFDTQDITVKVNGSNDKPII